MDRLKLCSNWMVLFMIAGNFVVRFLITDAASPNANSNVCQTEACKNIATSILQKMNQTVNPCDDFYEFVCGNFSRNAEIPPSRPRIGLFIKLSDIVQMRLRNGIENQITANETEAFQKLLTYYKTCMDEDQIERTSSKDFLSILNKLGGWPVLLPRSYDIYYDLAFDWKDAIDKINKMGYSYNYFLSTKITTDYKNNTRNLIFLDQPVFGISQEYLSQGMENDIVKAYFKYMVEVAEIFGADRNRAEKELAESLKFEIELAKISLSTSERRDPKKLYNPMTIWEVQSKYPYIFWQQYLNNKVFPYHFLFPDEEVIVSVPSFFESLGKLLARTPKRVLANYALWRVAHASSTQLNQKVQDANREFRASLTGNRNKIPRWQTCINSASANLYIATGALYVRKNFDKASKNGAADMVKHLQQAFKTMLLGVDWMDEATRSAALQKLEQIIPFVGYFDELLDDEKINNYYKDLKLHPKSYLKTVLSYKRFTDINQLKSFRDSKSRVDWTIDNYASDIVNAFYEPNLNIIQFPAGILQGDFYNKGYPKYVNYASIGSIIGHEITHGFDDEGSGFDSFGNMVDWWQADTKKEYLRRAKCIVDQYSSYVDPQAGMHLNGDLTQGENIADNGGVKEAYLAYTVFEGENGVESTLPGFEAFTSRQLFWISYSNVWCTRYRTEHLKNLIATDPHAPGHFRVIGALSNNAYFAKDFNCPTGSPMNPEKKCSVW